MRTGIIYLITNTVNGKKYVGQTVRKLSTRWNIHKADARNGCDFIFHRAIRKYGPDSFTVESIAEITAGDGIGKSLNQLEILFVYIHDSYNSGYNMNLGGGSSALASPETRAKMSVSQRKRGPHSEETKQRMREAHGKGEMHRAWGIKMSKETTEKRLASLRKRYAVTPKPPVSDETRANMSAASRDPKRMAHAKALGESNRGKQYRIPGTFNHSEDAKVKMSLAKKGKPWTEARRLAQSLSKAA